MRTETESGSNGYTPLSVLLLRTSHPKFTVMLDGGLGLPVFFWGNFTCIFNLGMHLAFLSILKQLDLSQQ